MSSTRSFHLSCSTGILWNLEIDSWFSDKVQHSPGRSNRRISTIIAFLSHHMQIRSSILRLDCHLQEVPVHFVSVFWGPAGRGTSVAVAIATFKYTRETCDLTPLTTPNHEGKKINDKGTAALHPPMLSLVAHSMWAQGRRQEFRKGGR